MQDRSTATKAAWSSTALAALLAASLGALALLTRRLLAVAPTGPDAVRTTRIDGWVEAGVLTIGSIAAAWMVAGATAALLGVVVARLGGARYGAALALGRWTPAVVRRLARGALGVGVGAGLVLSPGVALADDTGTGTGDAVTLELGWESTAAAPTAGPELPERPAEVETEPSAPVAATAATTNHADAARALGGTQHASRQVDGADGADERDADTGEVVVVQGDTLWDIAARDLPDDASPGEVLRQVTRWHETNRAVVGDDPDLILPGQVLRTP